MLRRFLLSLVVFFCMYTISSAQEPLMSANWSKEFCTYWNEPLQTTMADWPKCNVNKEKGYKTIAFYRSDCQPKVISEVEVKYEDGKAACVYGVAKKTLILSLLYMRPPKIGNHLLLWNLDL